MTLIPHNLDNTSYKWDKKKFPGAYASPCCEADVANAEGAPYYLQYASFSIFFLFLGFAVVVWVPTPPRVVRLI
jgi:hypothetical protein